MAHELIMMAKEKYENLMKSCQTSKNNGQSETHTVDTSIHRSKHDTGVHHDSDQPPLFNDIIDYTIPKKMQRIADGLFRFLQQQGGDVIKWNQRGHLILNGEVIEASHIIDLLRDAVCPKTVNKPLGYEKCYQALKAISTPTSFIANAYVKTTPHDNIDEMFPKKEICIL